MHGATLSVEDEDEEVETLKLGHDDPGSAHRAVDEHVTEDVTDEKADELTSPIVETVERERARTEIEAEFDRVGNLPPSEEAAH